VADDQHRLRTPTVGVVGVAAPQQGSVVMPWLSWFLLVLLWLAIAFWPARVAARKGHSFIGFFLFSVVFFPAAIITAYLVADRTVRAPV
jgi:hypothetical protein